MKCLNCQKILIKKQKFCCVKCSNQYNGKHKKIGGDLGSLSAHIKLHGEIKGEKIYNEKSKKLSNSLKNKPSYFKGKKHSKKSKNLMSQKIKNSDYNKNRKSMTEKDKNKLSTYMKGYVWTLRWFIDKYGEKEGQRKYIERSKNLSKSSYWNIYNKKNKNNFSKISQELFWILFKQLKLKKKNVYFFELNHEYSCKTGRWNFDFVIKDRKKIIEFNGDRWHANPKIFKANDTPNPYYKNLTAREIWENDNNKRKAAEIQGYEILIIWESNYKMDKEKEIEKCLDFLKYGKLESYDINNPDHNNATKYKIYPGDCMVHTKLSLDALNDNDSALIWATLLHDVGKPETQTFEDRIRFDGHANVGASMTKRILQRLRRSNHFVEEVSELVKDHMKFKDLKKMKKSTLKKFLRKENIQKHLELHRVDCVSSNNDLSNWEFAKEQLELLPPETLNPPALLTGKNLIDMGFQPSPRFREILRKVEEMQLEGFLNNEEEALKFVEENFKRGE